MKKKKFLLIGWSRESKFNCFRYYWYTLSSFSLQLFVKKNAIFSSLTSQRPTNSLVIIIYIKMNISLFDKALTES